MSTHATEARRSLLLQKRQRRVGSFCEENCIFAFQKRQCPWTNYIATPPE
jgi:hypothetical protein